MLKLACWNIDGTVLRNQQDSATLDSFVSSQFLKYKRRWNLCFSWRRANNLWKLEKEKGNSFGDYLKLDDIHGPCLCLVLIPWDCFSGVQGYQMAPRDMVLLFPSLIQNCCTGG